MSEEPSNRMPLSEVRKTREYDRLTLKQKIFVDTYITGGVETGKYDQLEATLAAYGPKEGGIQVPLDRDMAKRMSYAIMRNIKIIEVLNRHFGMEPIEAFLVEIDRAVRNKKITMPQVKALQLKAQVLEYMKKLRGPKDPKNPIGAILEDAVAHKKSKKPKSVSKKSAPTTSPSDDYAISKRV